MHECDTKWNSNQRDIYQIVLQGQLGSHWSDWFDGFTFTPDEYGQTILDGDLYAALAANNGGPGNSKAWKNLAPDDPDLFLEVIRFEETRRYIRSIYEIFTIYRRLYDRSG